MPTPDYDGARSVYEREMSESRKALIIRLKEAMDDGEITHQAITTSWQICDNCQGDGGHSLRFGAMTSEEFSEWSDESREAYLTGRYDEPCDECNGTGKVREIDYELLTEDAREWIDEYLYSEYEMAECSRQERMYGC